MPPPYSESMLSKINEKDFFLKFIDGVEQELVVVQRRGQQSEN